MTTIDIDRDGLLELVRDLAVTSIVMHPHLSREQRTVRICCATSEMLGRDPDSNHPAETALTYALIVRGAVEEIFNQEGVK